MINTQSKSLYLALFLVLMLAALTLTSYAAGITDIEYNDGYYEGIYLDVNNVDIPYDNGDGLYTITKLNSYGGVLQDEYFYIISNQLNFYYDVLPLYNQGSTFNDSAIVSYFIDKYPTTDFTYLSDSLNTSDTYLSTLFNAIRADYSFVTSTSYESGYNSGYNAGHVVGYDDGKSAGYSQGFTEGNINGMNETKMLKTGLLTILSSPLYVLGGILDFEIFGLNLFEMISTILSIMIVAFIIKHLLL